MSPDHPQNIASVCQLQMTAAGTLVCMLLAVPEAVQLAVKLSLAMMVSGCRAHSSAPDDQAAARGPCQCQDAGRGHRRAPMGENFRPLRSSTVFQEPSLAPKSAATVRPAPWLLMHRCQRTCNASIAHLLCRVLSTHGGSCRLRSTWMQSSPTSCASE